MDAAITADDPLRYLDINWRFHLLIYQASGMPLMCSIIQQLMARAAPYVRLGLNDNRDHMNRAMSHHYAVVAALQRGDGASARKAIEQDIVGATDDFLKLAGEIGKLRSSEHP
jgi:DNA-binding GntR family transcriptional regulator